MMRHFTTYWNLLMQLDVKFSEVEAAVARQISPSTLAELASGEEAVLERLDVEDDIARRLMELGFLPGSTVSAAHSAPGGDPRVFRVDGSEIALRREMAAHIHLRPPTQ
jgi:ferrous iron transport protein A